MEAETDFMVADGGAGSDSESDHEDNERAHSKLLDAISSLDGKPRSSRVQRTEASSKVSEFHVSSGKEKVRLHELIGALRTNTNLGSLKKQLNRVQKKKRVLQTPLAKHEQEKIQRNLAYEATAKEVSKWDSIVTKNRKADQLQFPLEQPNLRLISSDQFVKRFTPHTPLEMEVAALLQGSAHTQLPKQRELTEAEERALKAMSVEEARERRAELQKYRALLSYKEAKARRQSKIKSKKYHRILRKEKVKQQSKSLEELQKTDPQAFAETLHRLENDRMKERMSLKHRGGSKFMTNQKLFSKYDAQARQSVQEMNQKSRELTKKLAIESESEEEEQQDAVADIADKVSESVPSGSSDNPWMSVVPLKRVKKKGNDTADSSSSKQKNDVDRGDDVLLADPSGPDEESDGELKKQVVEAADIDEIFSAVERKKQKAKERRLKRKQKRPLSVRERGFNDSARIEDSSDSSESSSEEDDVGGSAKRTFLPQTVEVFEPKLDSMISGSLSRKQTLEDFEADWSGNDSDEDDVDRELVTQQQQQQQQQQHLSDHSKKENSTKSAEKDAQVDPKKFFTVESKIKSLQKPETVTNEDDDDDDKEVDDGNVSEEEDQRMTIAQAFASDDVVDEFLAEKKDTEERDKPKDVDLSLPGWGDWGGVGLQPSKRKKKRFTLKASTAPPRKDRDLDNVIISQTKDNAVAKHQVSDLPFPFNSVEQFESSVRAPIGKTWNPETAYRELIKPKVVTKMGSVISPIDKATTFKKQQKGAKRHSKGDIDISEDKQQNTTGKRRKDGGRHAKRKDVKAKK